MQSLLLHILPWHCVAFLLFDFSLFLSATIFCIVRSVGRMNKTNHLRLPREKMRISSNNKLQWHLLFKPLFAFYHIDRIIVII